jgi:hypothetical protein
LDRTTPLSIALARDRPRLALLLYEFHPAYYRLGHQSWPELPRENAVEPKFGE